LGTNRLLTLTVILLSLTVLISCNGKKSSSSIVVEELIGTGSPELNEIVELDEYGFPVQQAAVKTGKVKRNESLYLILENLDVSPNRIWEIQKEAEKVFNISRIMPGQKYLAYLNPGKPEQAYRLVYHPNPLDYYVIDWEDEIRIEKGKKEVEKVVKTAAGVIRSSLYESLTRQKLSPLIAYSLSEVYAWQIDFFRLYPNDRYRVIYEEEYIDGNFYGLGKILAAEFIHQEQSFKVFYFEDQEQAGYFNENGKSVQKALLKAPFRFSQRISSGFSHNRFHPVLKRRMPHYGVDYAAPLGTPVISVGDGEIIEARYRGANGNIVKIRHNGTYTTAYLHLNGFAKGIRRGESVKQGQVIGYVGKTGRVTGVHLDYRIYKNNRPVNPLKIELPASRSVHEKSLPAFSKVKEYMLTKLQQTDFGTELASTQ